MPSLSYFHDFVNLIKVADVCSKFAGAYDGNEYTSSISAEWYERSEEDFNFNPDDQIGLVTIDGKVEGHFGIEEISVEAQLYQCMDRIEPSRILSSDTPIIEAVNACSNSDYYYFFIIKGNQFIGWLSLQDLYKMPFKFCIFTLLMNIEKLMIEGVLAERRLAI